MFVRADSKSRIFLFVTLIIGKPACFCTLFGDDQVNFVQVWITEDAL